MNKKHLPLFGVGPIYCFTITFITVLGIILTKFNIIPNLNISYLNILFYLLSLLSIILGLYLWISSINISNIHKNIKMNKLVTTGIYSKVRNPIYSSFLFINIGILLINGNIYLFILPFLYWLFLTILMINTEEKWLYHLYKDEYTKYCKKVNRCIPSIRR